MAFEKQLPHRTLDAAVRVVQISRKRKARTIVEELMETQKCLWLLFMT